MSFPLRLEDITVEWLDELFGSLGLLASARVTGVQPERMSGQGGTSVVYALKISYDRPDHSGPEKLLAKFSSEVAAIREAVREYRLYQREIAFYARYAKDPGIPTPRCYASGYEPAENRCFLLLEYIESAHMREMHAGSPADVEIAVKYLAPFHARWWGRSKELVGIESENSSEFLEQRMQKVTRGLQKISNGFRDDFGKEPLAIVELWLAHARSIAAHFIQRPLTMCHGSFHRGQILFSDPPENSLFVIDWQSVSIDLGAIDLSRIILSGLLPDQRKQYEQHLVEMYHQILIDGGVKGYSLPELWDDYRLGIINLLVFHTQIFADYDVAVVAKRWKGSDSFWDALFKWPAAAAEDCGAFEWFRKMVANLDAET
jgi:hypothetical protein